MCRQQIIVITFRVAKPSKTHLSKFAAFREGRGARALLNRILQSIIAAFIGLGCRISSLGYLFVTHSMLPAWRCAVKALRLSLCECSLYPRTSADNG